MADPHIPPVGQWPRAVAIRPRNDVKKLTSAQAIAALKPEGAEPFESTLTPTGVPPLTSAVEALTGQPAETAAFDE